MVLVWALVAATALLGCCAEPVATDKKLEPIVVCYVSSWAIYRPGNGKFEPSNVDPNLCSHIVYAFAGINPKDYTIKSLDPWNDLEDDGGKGGYKKITQLRNINRKLKVSLAIGGWNEGSANYSAMASTAERRTNFINSVVEMLRKHDFDGFDLDWEYPTERGGRPEDKQNFVLLTKELRRTFDDEKLRTGRSWLLTSAIGASPSVINSAYDLPSLSQYLDYLHIMSYDYHGSWEPVAGVNAPLRGRSDEDKLSVEKTLELILSSGAKKEKILLGLPFYGRTFIANNMETPKLGSDTQKGGFSGPWTKEAGYMGYNEICAELQQNSTQWKTIWDERSATHYAVRDRQLITYDDPKSIDAKVRFGMKKGIAGMMVWSLDTDDFKGSCMATTGHTNYPLLRTINKALIESLEERENEIVTNKKESIKGNSSSRTATSFLSLLTGLIAISLMFQ